MARAATSRNFFGFGSKRKPASRGRRPSAAKRAQRSQEKLSVANLIDRAYAKGHDLGRIYCCGSSMRPSDSEIAQQFSDWISGQNVSERIRSLKATPRTYKHDPVLRHVFGAFGHGYMDASKEKNPCARTLKTVVSDRAKRYRANQKGCRPSGVKKCKLCGSKSDVMVDHVDGNESNGRKSNLRWLCRSCNNTLAAEMAREGRGRRTVQYNPAHKGALTLGEYMQAVLQHTRGAHDAAGKIIHDTPKSRRREFASEIWARRESHGTARPGSSSAGYDEPDWVRNPPDEYTRALYADAEQSGRDLGMEDRRADRTKKHRPQIDYIAIDRFKDQMDHDKHQSGVIGYFLKGYNQGWAAGVMKGHKSARQRVGGDWWGEAVPAMNPQSIEYRLGYNLGQTDRQTAQLHRTDDELTATCKAQFPNWQSVGKFISGYDDGYGFGSSAAGESDAGGHRGENPLPHPRYAETAFEAGAETARMYKRINIRPDRTSLLTNFKAWQHQHKHMVQSAPGARRVDASKRPEHLEQFTAGFRSEAPAQWSGRNPHANWGYGVYAQDTRSAFQSSDQVAFFKTAREAKAFAESHNDELKAAGKWYSQVEPHYHVRKALRSAGNPAGRRNPEPDSEEYRQAKKTAELFHGRPVQEEIEVEEKIKTHDWYVSLGPLISLKVRTVAKKNVTLPFHRDEKNVVHLFTSPDGRQFYLRGGDQELDVKALGMGPDTDWFRDLMVIGEAKEITYRDRKKFHKFKLTDYYHKLGEVTRQRPMLAYDSLAHKLSIIGGQYKVETEDLVDGMSPGIVN